MAEDQTAGQRAGARGGGGAVEPGDRGGAGARSYPEGAPSECPDRFIYGQVLFLRAVGVKAGSVSDSYEDTSAPTSPTAFTLPGIYQTFLEYLLQSESVTQQKGLD